MWLTLALIMYSLHVQSVCANLVGTSCRFRASSGSTAGTRHMDTTVQPIADGVEQRLDPRVVDLRRLRNTIGAAVVAAVLCGFAIGLWVAIGRWSAGLLFVPLWLGLSGAAAWHLRRWPRIAYAYASYRVDDLGIEIRTGVYFRRITNVPRSRVQHTDVSQGPLERRYSLGTLVVYTAGTHHSEVTLSGLEFTIAQRIRAHLLPRDQGDAV